MIRSTISGRVTCSSTSRLHFIDRMTRGISGHPLKHVGDALMELAKVERVVSSTVIQVGVVERV